jgi:hypothetical protein
MANYLQTIENAEKIKALLIDHFTKKKKTQILFGSEVFYGSIKRQADLILIENRTTAFEIKSNKDNFKLLKSQLENYNQVFDYLYLVTTETKELEANKYINNEGLIIIDSKNKIKIKKRAKLNKNFDKYEILESVPSNYLKFFFEIPQKLKSSSEIRKLLLKKNINDLKNTFRSFLIDKLKDRNILFNNEKGEHTHYEDLKILSTNISIS